MAVKDSLGDRMKENYENRYRFFLTRRTPVIIRIDGKAFHTFTRKFKRPFDYVMTASMQDTALYLCGNVMGCRLAYTQSDEISLLLTDYRKLTSQAWFDNNLQKIASVSASMATMAFNNAFGKNAEACRYFSNGQFADYLTDVTFYREQIGNAMFDARAFNIPESEVCNYFIWRQQDATRNSIESAGHAYFSTKELHKKNCQEIQEKLFGEKGIQWNHYPTMFKRGSAVRPVRDGDTAITGNWVVDNEIPLFTQDRDYIEQELVREE